MGAPHPFALSPEDEALLDELRALPLVDGVRTTDWAHYERLMDIMGRLPGYETLPGTNDLDYSKPIKVNSRFQDEALATSGYENLMFRGRPVVLKDCP
jgi:hypothetical protein